MNLQNFACSWRPLSAFLPLTRPGNPTGIPKSRSETGGNRRYQLELSSIDPYLANLPDDVQQKVKVDLAQKLFGNASAVVETATAKFSGTGKEPLELALATILEVVKKRP